MIINKSVYNNTVMCKNKMVIYARDNKNTNYN